MGIMDSAPFAPKRGDTTANLREPPVPTLVISPRILAEGYPTS